MDWKHRHHRLYVITHPAHMYINPCSPLTARGSAPSLKSGSVSARIVSARSRDPVGGSVPLILAMLLRLSTDLWNGSVRCWVTKVLGTVGLDRSVSADAADAPVYRPQQRVRHLIGSDKTERRMESIWGPSQVLYRTTPGTHVSLSCMHRCTAVHAADRRLKDATARFR
jgi:hypothetical protein